MTREQGFYRDAGRKYVVLVDDKIAAKLRSGQSTNIEVAAGRHDVSIKVDWYRSPHRSIVVDGDAVVDLICRPGGPAWRSLIDWFRPHSYISLEICRPDGVPTV